MNWVTGTVVYILIWWTALFAVLPVGTKPVQDPDDRSGWRGAPERPMIMRKLLITTIVAAVLWIGCNALISSDLISFRHGFFAAPELPD